MPQFHVHFGCWHPCRDDIVVEAESGEDAVATAAPAHLNDEHSYVVWPVDGCYRVDEYDYYDRFIGGFGATARRLT